MRRLLFLAALGLLLLGSFEGRLDAQVIPLAPGNEWVYHDSGLHDTVAVRIMGNGPASIRCARGRQSHAAWFDNGGYSYLPVGGGVMICRSQPSEKVLAAVEPLLFLADTTAKTRSMIGEEKGCQGSYTMIGMATVETPAGTFEKCLIFDDNNVHRLFIKPGVGIVREERYREGGEPAKAAGERVLSSSRVLLRYTQGGVGR